jgi:hypothetical protein
MSLASMFEELIMVSGKVLASPKVTPEKSRMLSSILT